LNDVTDIGSINESISHISTGYVSGKIEMQDPADLNSLGKVAVRINISE